MKSSIKSIEAIITKALYQFGFSPIHSGFFYLKDAVRIAYFEQDAITLVTKLIYLPLAKEYDTTVDNIEKSIRKSADAVWKNNAGSTIAVMNTIYTFSENHIENKELISLICNIIKQTINIFDTDIGEGI